MNKYINRLFLVFAVVSFALVSTMTRFYKGDVTMASDHLPIYVDVQF